MTDSTSSPSDADRLQERLRALEAEVDAAPSPNPSSSNAPSSQPTSQTTASTTAATNWSAEVSILGRQLWNWFLTLPSVGKGLAAIGGMFVLLSLLKIAVSLAAAAISCTVLGIAIYAAYRFWVAPNNNRPS